MLCLLSDGIIKLRPEKNAGFSEKKNLPKQQKAARIDAFHRPNKYPN
jgi:hypothetical protein